MFGGRGTTDISEVAWASGTPSGLLIEVSSSLSQWPLLDRMFVNFARSRIKSPPNEVRSSVKHAWATPTLEFSEGTFEPQAAPCALDALCGG
jgi:hypothetical protein